MEQETWIQNILESTNGITPAMPNENLWAKIHNKIQQQNYVSPKTVWLVAASIAILVILNITLLKTKTEEKTMTPSAYFENSLNKSNQLYQ
jgi:fucose permease